MVADRERARRLVGNQQAADRQTVRETLRERDELRADAEPLEGEERAGAPDAGLHLVEGQQRSELGGELRRGGDELRGERDHAAFPEHRLEQDQADVLAGDGTKRGGVVRHCEAGGPAAAARRRRASRAGR